MKLKCKFFDWFNAYTCEVSSAAITKPSTEIKNIKGNHKAGKSEKEVQDILLKGVVHFIPRGLTVLFPNVTRLEINGCGLKSVCRDDLKQFKNLDTLFLDRNKLKTLPDDLFQDTPNLAAISLCDNRIESMSSKLFDPIINNEFLYIDLQRNIKIDAIYGLEYDVSVECLADLLDIIDSQCSKPEPIEPQASTDTSLIHLQNFSKGFENLFDSRKFSDFVINVYDLKRFRVHKLVLAAQCEVFAEMFDEDPGATEMKIEDLSIEAVETPETQDTMVDDLSPVAVEKFLRCLYTGKLENFTEHSLEIFAVSSKLKAHGLTELIEEFIVDHIESFDALKVFSMAHSFKSEKLKQAAFEVIQENLGRILPEEFIENLEVVEQIVDVWKNFNILTEIGRKQNQN